MGTWVEGAPGVLRLPSGRLVRGRALRRPLPTGPLPEHAVYLLGEEPDTVPWPFRWIRWPDFGLPLDGPDARQALREAWQLSASNRLEVGCSGGRGRTGTALACLVVLDGVPASKAAAYVRRHYHRRAAETPAQRRWVLSFSAGPAES